MANNRQNLKFNINSKEFNIYDSSNARDSDSVFKFQRNDSCTMENKRQIERRSATIFEYDMSGVGGAEALYMNQEQSVIEMTNCEKSDILSVKYGEVLDALNHDDDIYTEIDES